MQKLPVKRVVIPVFPPNFKRRKVQAVRDFPVGCNIHPTWPMYPPPRKVSAVPDFHAGFNVPTFSECSKSQPLENAKVSAVGDIHVSFNLPAEPHDDDDDDDDYNEPMCGDDSDYESTRFRVTEQATIPPKSRSAHASVPFKGKCMETIVLEDDDDETISGNSYNYEDRTLIEASNVCDTLNIFRETSTTMLLKESVNKETIKKTYSINLKVAMQMKEQNQWINTRKHIGSIDGINRGDKFLSRAELVIIGLHCRFQDGIDYLKMKNGKSLATSVVDSSRYDNDMLSFHDVFTYCGKGGNPRVGNKPLKDQKLERGNLALYNSMLEKSPVRLIRSMKVRRKTSYIYDGLYIVEEVRQDRGEFGKLVFKYQLRRITDQARLNFVEQPPLN